MLPHHLPAPVPAFEDDLKAAREARQRTLDDVQQETRIPVNVLRRFESGELASDSTYNTVYLKAFIQSYAKAVGVSQSAAVEAFEAARSGAYNGQLAPDYDPKTAPKQTAPAPPVADAVPGDAAPPSIRAAKPPATPERPAADVRASAAPASPVTALSAPSSAEAAAPAAPVAGARVVRPSVKGARRSYDKNWTTIIGLTVAVVLVLAGVIYMLFRGDDAPETDTLVASSGVAAQIDSAGVGAGAAAGGPQFQLPISVTVAATGDGLQSFRVSEDGARAPYWVNSGESQTFTADSSLTLWGEGSGAFFSDAVIELQGIRWTPADGQAVVIDPARGQALLDSLAAAGTAAPAPDSAL